MANLGSFGAAVKELDPGGERDTFDFFDQQFTIHGTLPPVLQIQLGAAATGKIEEAEGLAAIWETMRCCLSDGEDGSQFDRWFKLAVARRCTLEELLKLAFALFEAQAGRPTEGPSTSSAGLPTTSPNANGSSTPQGRLVPVAELLG